MGMFLNFFIGGGSLLLLCLMYSHLLSEMDAFVKAELSGEKEGVE